MPTRREIPLLPRVSAPDLPPRLDDGEELAPHSDVVGARWTALAEDTDAAHSDIAECAFESVRADRLTLTGATLTDVDISDSVLTQVSAASARWRNVRVTGGRIATLDLTDADLDSVELRGIRIDYLSLGSARVADLRVVDCAIRTLDVPMATLSRVSFESSRADEVDNRGMRAEHADLRGLDAVAYLDPTSLRGTTLRQDQVALHAAAFAAALGVHVAG